jgi:hypothetical protein
MEKSRKRHMFKGGKKWVGMCGPDLRNYCTLSKHNELNFSIEEHFLFRP